MRVQGNLPLSEHLRPKNLGELAISERYISKMQAMLDEKVPASMLFFGAPGTGKTSAARIFCEARGTLGTLEVDGSKDNGIDYIRKVVEGFTTSYALTDGIKIVFIDDGDYLTAPAQAALRGLIERSSANSRFIMAVNDVTTIDKPIRSRLLCLHFGIPSAELPDILKKTQQRVALCLEELGWSFDRERLNQIVSDNLSDLRAMANKLELEFRYRPALCSI